MRAKRNLHAWIDRNRLLLWWALFLPIFMIILFLNWNELQVLPEAPEDPSFSFFDKAFGSRPLVMLARVALLAAGVVVIMIAVFFPAFRVGSKGIQWSRELEEEVARASGEVTAEEIEELVREESLRWATIYRWLKLREQEQEPSTLMRELPLTIREFFPGRRLSLSLEEDGRRWALLHPLWPWLIPERVTAPEETVLGLNLPLDSKTHLFLVIYRGTDGFSTVDEGFLLVLGEVFLYLLEEEDFALDQTEVFFQRVSLTEKPAGV